MSLPDDSSSRLLPPGVLHQLKRWNTPTIYNGWEQITKRNPAAEGINLEETRDFMPQMGPMVGYAVTVVIEPSQPEHRQTLPTAGIEYRRYVASVPGPKIVVVQDLDKPGVVGSFWGEVNSSMHRALGCVGTITDGAIRDVDEMTDSGFKALARRLCVGHAFVHPVRWNCEVEVFGTKVRPGDLIHADKHGFLVVAPEEQERLLDASVFMDQNECETVIPAARNSENCRLDEKLEEMESAIVRFGDNLRAKFHRDGEW
ncbi:MAG: RraA family protein [Verrucomicrobiae bacterium]|nr:RraA family protein [Verrucomicrobiae bacterium]